MKPRVCVVGVVVTGLCSGRGAERIEVMCSFVSHPGFTLKLTGSRWNVYEAKAAQRTRDSRDMLAISDMHTSKERRWQWWRKRSDRSEFD